MIQLELTLNGEETIYNIPTSWEDITVGKFAELYSTDLSELHPIEALVKTISVLSDINEDTLYAFSPEQFKSMSDYFTFTNMEIEMDKVDSIHIEGDDYYLKNDFKAFTFGEMTSIEIMMEGSGGNFMKCMDKMLCIYLRQKMDNGELEPFHTRFMSRAPMFKDVKISQVYHLFAFFLNINEQ